MHSEDFTPTDGAFAKVEMNSGVEEKSPLRGRYDFVCIGADGKVKWTDSIENVVVTVGKNDMLDKYFQGSSYTAAWYMGLIDNTSVGAGPAIGNTLSSHSPWLEFLGYNYASSGTNRASVSWAAASAGAKSSTAAVFNITASGTIYGALLCTTQARNTTTDGGAGILFSAGAFSGTRAVINNDTLNVTYTLTLN
ncbi:hypothetical protein UFOVP274_31 [uncultured Caudovirales phage]|uniref:Uncharacterized protein n=1 Tax=uncultured Caudovirales phage TaxID=2100421 RepID=A0A6J5LJ80_9CAUD|nr:hypothetical protein UFOVP274_31 [uncultured Caudovirales phage]